MVATARFVLDANIISELTKPRADRALLSRFKRYRNQACTAAPVLHELHFGVQVLVEGSRKKFLTAFLEGLSASGLDVLPYDQRAAQWHAVERARLQRAGKPRPFVDGQIAAIAAVNDAVLITRNMADFAPFRDLRVRNWFGSTA
jgi:tRNA(fMet)-specific endonuclease VapC